MVVYLIVGAPQTGKTTFVKNNILNKYRNVLLYDVQDQYPELKWYKRGESGKMRISPTDIEFEKFVMLATAIPKTLFIFEEATQFLEGKISKMLKSCLVGKAHTKNRFCFIFHSFDQVPPRIIDYADYIIQFSTGISDTMDKVKYLPIKEAHVKLEHMERFSKIIHRVSVLAKENIY